MQFSFTQQIMIYPHFYPQKTRDFTDKSNPKVKAIIWVKIGKYLIRLTSFMFSTVILNLKQDWNYTYLQSILLPATLYKNKLIKF